MPLTLFSFFDFSKIFDTIDRKGFMKTILLKYGLPQEIVIRIMMLYEDTQSMVRPTDGDTQYFKSQPECFKVIH